MNTAAALVIASAPSVALQMPADPAVPAAAGDFTAALAAACTAGPDAGVPEDMQSAAALAWLVGLSSNGRPSQSQPGSDSLEDSSDLTEPVEPGVEASSVAALTLLQGMLASATPTAPREDAEESGVATTAFGATDVQRSAALAIETVGNAIGTAVTADLPEAPSSPEAAVPVVVLSSARSAEAPADSTIPVPADDIITTSVTAFIADSVAKDDAAVESSRGERLAGALAERFSMRTEDDGDFQPVADRGALGGANSYANTREIVATQAGAASNRPEVVHATVGSPRWANELGSRLAMMSVRGQQEGSLSLTPEHLGPLEVRISVNQDSTTTNVWFGAQHADTRAALLDALPRLREMFAGAGLALGQAGVSHEMPGQEARRGEAPASRITADSDSPEAVTVRAGRVTSGLLDTWA